MKIKKTYTRCWYAGINLVFFFLISPVVLVNVKAQSLNVQARIRTVLELSAGATTVTSNAQILLDSSLSMSGRNYKISRAPVIMEGLDSLFCAKYANWMKTGNVDSMIERLSGLSKLDEPGVRLLIGAWYAYQPGAEHYR